MTVSRLACTESEYFYMPYLLEIAFVSLLTIEKSIGSVSLVGTLKMKHLHRQ